MFKRLWSFCKKRWAYLVSIIFTWVIPIIMLNEKIALTETNIAFKITFVGCLVLLAIFIAFRKKIHALINRQPHGILRGVLMCIHKGISYGLFLGVLWGINAFSDKLYHWWLLSGISIAIGLIFLVVSEMLITKKSVEVKDNETNKD